MRLTREWAVTVDALEGARRTVVTVCVGAGAALCVPVVVLVVVGAAPGTYASPWVEGLGVALALCAGTPAGLRLLAALVAGVVDRQAG